MRYDEALCERRVCVCVCFFTTAVPATKLFVGGGAGIVEDSAWRRGSKIDIHCGLAAIRNSSQFVVFFCADHVEICRTIAFRLQILS